MSKKNKTKVEFEMKFNPALDKYEPELPVIKKKISKKQEKIRNKKAIWLLIILAFIFGSYLLYLLIKYL